MKGAECRGRLSGNYATNITWVLSVTDSAAF